jgi:hypothetical protein
MKRARARTKGPKYPRQKVRILGPERANARQSSEPRRKRADVEETTEAPDAWTPEKYREFTLRNEYLFDGDLAESYKRIKELPGIKPTKDYDGVPDDELRFELGKIIYLYRKRRRTIGYEDNVKHLISGVEAAAKSMDDLPTRLRCLDHEHRELLSNVMDKLVPANVMRAATYTGGGAVAELMVFTELGRHLMQALYVAVKLTTGIDPNFRPGRGKPKSEYEEETIRLCQLWTYLTGKSPVTPKRRVAKDKEESQEPSTEFIRLCLKMIDKRISLSKVQSNIKRALIAKKELIEFMFENKNSDTWLDFLRPLAVSDADGSQETPGK